MNPTINDVQAGGARYTVVFRDSGLFDDLSMPDWAQQVAADVCAGAEVRLGAVGTDSIVQAVSIRAADVDGKKAACELAHEIARRIDR